MFDGASEQFWTRDQIESLMILGRTGERWRLVGAALGKAPGSCSRKWVSLATTDDRNTRDTAITLSGRRVPRGKLIIEVPVTDEGEKMFIGTFEGVVFRDDLSARRDRGSLDRLPLMNHGYVPSKTTLG